MVPLGKAAVGAGFKRVASRLWPMSRERTAFGACRAVASGAPGVMRGAVGDKGGGGGFTVLIWPASMALLQNLLHDSADILRCFAMGVARQKRHLGFDGFAHFWIVTHNTP